MEDAFLGKDRTAELWAKTKATLGATIEATGSTITLKNAAATPQILSQVTIPNATQSIAGAFAATDKSKLDGIASGATKVIVDAALTATGTNPVQGKAVQGALDGKLATSGTAAAASKLATARTIGLSGDLVGSTTFNGTANVSIDAVITELTDVEIEAICVMPGGGVEGVSEVAPVGKWMFFDPGISPASIFGGTWAKRTDTYLYMGCCIWKRVS